MIWACLILTDSEPQTTGSRSSSGSLGARLRRTRPYSALWKNRQAKNRGAKLEKSYSDVFGPIPKPQRMAATIKLSLWRERYDAAAYYKNKTNTSSSLFPSTKEARLNCCSSSWFFKRESTSGFEQTHPGGFQESILSKWKRGNN